MMLTKTWQQHIEKQDALVKDLEARLEKMNASAQATAPEANEGPATKVSRWVFLEDFDVQSYSPPAELHMLLITVCHSRVVQQPPSYPTQKISNVSSD